MKFEIIGKEEEKLLEFYKHKCTGDYVGSIGGRFSIIITPTSLGTFTSVKCNLCGDSIDITDCENW